MYYNSPNREVTFGVSLKLKMPDDSSPALNLLQQLKSEVTVVESYRRFDLPKGRDDVLRLLGEYGNVVYTEDYVAHIPKGKMIEDALVHFMLDLWQKSVAKKDTLQADSIFNKLREIGVAVTPRRGSAVIWNSAGLIT